MHNMFLDNKGTKLEINKMILRKPHMFENVATHFQIIYGSKKKSQGKLCNISNRMIKIQHMKMCGVQQKQYLQKNFQKRRKA